MTIEKMLQELHAMANPSQVQPAKSRAAKSKKK